MNQVKIYSRESSEIDELPYSDQIKYVNQRIEECKNQNVDSGHYEDVLKILSQKNDEKIEPKPQKKKHKGCNIT